MEAAARSDMAVVHPERSIHKSVRHTEPHVSSGGSSTHELASQRAAGMVTKAVRVAKRTGLSTCTCCPTRRRAASDATGR